MTDSIAEKKNQARKDCRQIRQALGEETRAQASQSICLQIEEWPIFQRAHGILSYMPVKSEVDLRPLLERQPGKRWVLPRILPEENHRMVFHPYDLLRLVLHPFGMVEPQADLPVIPPAEINLVLAPGLAFDRNGWRLGYGGGYFDRFLYEFRGVSLGVTFEALLFADLPHDSHDVPMNWLVTESGFYPANSKTSSPNLRTARSIG